MSFDLSNTFHHVFHARVLLIWHLIEQCDDFLESIDPHPPL